MVLKKEAKIIRLSTRRILTVLLFALNFLVATIGAERCYMESSAI